MISENNNLSTNHKRFMFSRRRSLIEIKVVERDEISVKHSS